MKSKTFLFLFLVSWQASASSKVVDYLFNQDLKTEAFVVLKDNKLIYSKFSKGDLSTKHLVWSMSKSITSLIFGVAEDKGFINRNASVCEKLPCPYKDLQAKHLLHMTSGIDWKELYEGDPFNSHIVRLLYFETKKSIVNYVLNVPKKYTAGERFYYSSGDTNLINGLLQKSLPKGLQDSYPWEFLFDPLGLKNITFERDAEGVFVGSSYIYLSVEDLIKISMMIAADGEYLGKRIISKSYLDFARTIHPAIKKKCSKKKNSLTYGAQFWLNASCEGKKPLKSVAENVYAMLGHGGQSIFFVPDEKLIFIRIANDSDNKVKLRFEHYLNLAVEDFKGGMK